MRKRTIDLDEGPHAAAAFMANLSSTSGTNGATTRTSVTNVTAKFKFWFQLGKDMKISLVHAEVSRTKMSERLGTIKPINYTELNALYSHFVPQKELSREQVYWLPAEELATQKSNPPKPVTPFVRTRPAKSQISTCLQGLNSWIPAFAHVINQRTDPCRYPSGSGEFKPVKAMFTKQIIPFYENVKQLVQKLDENIVTEVTEYMRIFDELDTEYERCVLANKNLKIERKNLLIQNDCLIANSLEKDICSIMLASDIVVPTSSNFHAKT
ncbi:hypothetical protein Tco_1554380 [Tanacetum coccineum]